MNPKQHFFLLYGNHFKKWFSKQSFLIILFFFGITSAIFSQTKVSGKITNQDGVGMSQVSVTEKGKENGTITSDDGSFTLSVSNPKASLAVSSVGFISQEIPVNGKTSFNVLLKSNNAQMEEVVVTGYGTAKRATLTGAISTIKGSEITKSPATNVSNNLVGRLPGLSAVQGSGEPGADGSTLRIRGLNTLNDNGVLVVIDGIAGRNLERIDPNTIENVTVLKDASAAIYGARAANGVILITTKRGKSGKPIIGLNVNYGYNQPTKLPKMADAATFAQMNNELIIYNQKLPAHTDEWLAAYTALKETGVYISPTVGQVDASSLPIDGSPAGIKAYQDGSDPWGHPNTNWFKDVIKRWSGQTSYNLTLSGGSETMRYFVSLGTQGQEGNYYRSATRYDQYNFRTNIDAKINKNISLAFDVAGREEYRQFPTRSAGSIFRMTMRGKPTQPGYWPNGTPGPDIEYGDNPAVISTDVTGYDRDKNYVLNSNIKLVVNLPWIKGLSLTGNAAIDKGFKFRKLWQTPWYLYSWNYTAYDTVNGQSSPHLDKGKRGYDAPQLTQNYNDDYLLTANGLLNYENSFGPHAFKFLAGIEEIKGNNSYFSAFKTHYASPALDQLFAGAALDKDNNGSGSVSARLSYFGRVNYNYKSKYLAEFVWREDGSYIFPKNKRFGFFPGFSAGWVMSDENFFKDNIHFIDNFKLRGSWGKTGNDRIAEWQYLASYGSGNFLGYGYYPFVTNGNVENTTLYENIVPNPKVTWEVADQRDIGFNALLFKNKLSIEADYFNYKRSNILLQPNASVPLLAGYQPPYANIGKVTNKGFEFNVSYSGGNRKFNYKVGVNTSYAKNKITFWDEPAGAPEYQKSTGHPMNTGLYYIATGVFVDQTQVDKTPNSGNDKPGNLIFEDVNGDGKITSLDQKRIDKSNYPTFTGGLTLDLTYGQFDFSALFQSATGAVNYISTESGLIGNYLKSFADNRWTPENPNSKGPRAYDRDQGPGNTYYLHKTDYIRLKNLQLGYTFPSNLNHKLGLATTRIYFSGYNLLTYSPDYKDFDPELNSGGGQGYPLQRVVSFGISVTF